VFSFLKYFGIFEKNNTFDFTSWHQFSESQPGGKIDHFHSIRVSHLVSAEKLRFNQLFAELFLDQKSTIAGKLD